MQLTWAKRYATGNREIDIQHQELFRLLSEFEASQENGQSEYALKNVLPRLTAYAQYHCNAEQRLMAHLEPSRKATHLNRHLAFWKELVLIESDHRADLEVAAVRLLEYLERWLLKHMDEDRDWLPH